MSDDFAEIVRYDQRQMDAALAVPKPMLGSSRRTAADPLAATPPSAAEQARARVESDAALLSAAADRLEQGLAAGSPLPWFYNSYNQIFSGPKVGPYDRWIDTTGKHTLERRGDCPMCGEWREPHMLGTPGQGHGCRLFAEDYRRDPFVAKVPASAGDTATGAHAVDAELIATLINAGPDLVAWLRDAAREAVEVGANPFAAALARKVMGEGESA